MVEASPAPRISLQELEEAKAHILKLFNEDEPLQAFEELRKVSERIHAEGQPVNPSIINMLGELTETEQMQML